MTWSRTPAIGALIAAFVQFAVVILFVILIVTGVAGAGAMGLGITAVIMGLVGTILLFVARGMLRRYNEAQRLRVEGVAGQAQVLEMSQTGVTMNDQPQIRIRLMISAPGHGTYEKTVKEYVPLIMLGRLSSGAPLPVRVDPNDRENLIIDWSGGGGVQVVQMPMTAAPMGPGPSPADADAIKQRVLATGIPATARVLTVNYTGQLDEQGRPVYDVQLHIQVDGRPPMTGPARIGVPLERVSSMQVGAMIPLKVDQFNPAVMAADWARADA
jgi:hypothetical protein